MQGMNHLELAKEVALLSLQVTGGRIQRVFVTKDHGLVFDIRVPGRSIWLLISLHAALPRVHAIPEKPEVPQIPPAFCMSCRKHLVGKRITNLVAIENERIVRMQTENSEGTATLIGELFGTFANAFITGPNDRIIDLFFPRKAFARNLKTGELYKLPTTSKASRPPDNIRDFGDDISVYFDMLQTRLEFESAKKQLYSALLKQIKRSEKYLRKLKIEFENLEPPEQLQKQGELLSIHLKSVRKGMKSIEVSDIFLPDSPAITIPLDIKKDGPRNLEAIFKRAKRNRRKIEGLSGRIEQIGNLLLEHYECREKLENAENIEQIRIIRESCPDLTKMQAKRKAGKTGRAKPSGPLEFISADRVRILVGRNDKQNDRITFTLAKGNDYWLHVSDRPGSHVVILLGKSGELKQETLLDAATLALLHSKLGKENSGEVVYTKRKYVHKPKGMPPGKVTHSQSKSVFIRIDSKRVTRLMQSRDPQT